MPRALLAVLLLLAPAAAFAGEGFFRVAEEGGRSWLVDPQGRRLLSSGVNLFHEGYDPAEWDKGNPGYTPLRRHATVEDWYGEASSRLDAWGFNTLGGWSSKAVLARRGRPYTVVLHLGQHVGAPWVDVTQDWALDTMRALIEAEVRPRRDDPLLVGYFLDNELCWCDSSLFTYWAKQPAEKRLKGELVRLLREEYRGDLRALRRDFSVDPAPARFADLARELAAVGVRPGRRPRVVERFVALLAEEYYRALSALVREVDPNHLLLGDRYASYFSPPVAKAAGRYQDVVSVNYSPLTRGGFPAPSFFEALHQLSGRPVLVSEFYLAARENQSGNRNRHGPYLVVDTQAQRAAGVAGFVEHLARMPFVLGWHWFQWSDQPALGREDGEDFNMGLVDLEDGAYQELGAAFARVHAAAPAWHQEGPRARDARSLPAAPPKTLDGTLDEWELEKAWQAPGPAPARADAFLAWRPEGLLVALAYYDYGRHVAAEAPVSQRRRLELGGSGRATVLGLDERTADQRPAPLSLAGRQGGPAGAQQLRSLLTTAEVLIPARRFGRARLQAGDRLELDLALWLDDAGPVRRWPRRALVLAGPGGALWQH